MNNEKFVERFYLAFQKLDYATMQDCYANEIVFQDPTCGLLVDDEVRAFWEIFSNNTKNFTLVFSDIKTEDDEYFTCNLEAKYTFSLTGISVVNRINSYIRVQNRKITEHSDYYSFWKWSRQVFGLKGWIFGWNALFQSKVQRDFKKTLMAYLDEKDADIL